MAEVIRSTMASLSDSLPRWMVCYVLLGLVQSGMVPIILPLSARPGLAAGLTYAAFAATGIAAPFVGAWSDKHRQHRRTLVYGLALAGLALLADMLSGGIVQHMAAAALVGLGVSSASTVAMMFIVEVEPQSRWDERTSALQACIGGGQLVGLVIAGLLGLRHVGDAFLLGGCCCCSPCRWPSPSRRTRWPRWNAGPSLPDPPAGATRSRWTRSDLPPDVVACFGRAPP